MVRCVTRTRVIQRSRVRRHFLHLHRQLVTSRVSSNPLAVFLHPRFRPSSALVLFPSVPAFVILVFVFVRPHRLVLTFCLRFRILCLASQISCGKRHLPRQSAVRPLSATNAGNVSPSQRGLQVFPAPATRSGSPPLSSALLHKTSQTTSQLATQRSLVRELIS